MRPQRINIGGGRVMSERSSSRYSELCWSWTTGVNSMNGVHLGNGSSFSRRMEVTMGEISVNGVHQGEGPNAARDLRDKTSHSSCLTG